MKCTLLVGAAAVTLVAVSPQVSFAQPASSWNSNRWDQGNAQTAAMQRQMAPSPSAKFVFRRDSASVTCPTSDSLKDCVHAAIRLAANLSRLRIRRPQSNTAINGSDGGKAHEDVPMGNNGGSSRNNANNENSGNN